AEVMQLAVFVGVMGAALVSAIFLIRERARTSAQNGELRARLADANAALRRSEALLNLRDQRVVVWAAENKKPELVGTLPVESGAPED
ncbi:MAG: alkaline phosphatase, partial [Mesorhizobium sp.]